MSKIDLKDVTINIPFFWDSEDRVENLHFLVDYLTHHFDTNIIIKEVGKQSVLAGMPWLSGCEYVYEHSDDPIFHRTKVLNDLCRLSKTKVIANHDVDCILPIDAYVLSVKCIMEDKSDIVYGYNGKFMECNRDRLPILRDTMDFYSVNDSELNCLHPTSVGGIIFENREKFIKSGMENEKIIGWSFDDNCRAVRFEKLGLRVNRSSNYLLHVNHWRGDNSGPSNPYYQQNMQEYIKVNNMSKDQLTSYVSTWPWNKQINH